MTPTSNTHGKNADEMEKGIDATAHDSDIPSSALVDASGHYVVMEGKSKDDASLVLEEAILKIPALTIIYWCEKMTATTFGETFAEFFTQTLDFGYSATSVVLISVFIIFLAFQLRVKSYWPLLFLWRAHERAMNRKAEAFYWSVILVSNTLGTALGDFMADSLSLGFGPSAGIIGGLLCILAALAYFTKISHVPLFWIAFVLTRPFGATFGDLLTKSEAKGGLDLGTLKASMVILALFAVSFAVEMYNLQKAKREEKTTAETEEVNTKALDV